MTGERPTAAIVDLDGTVVSGRAVIDGLDALRAAGLPVVFLTNRATDAPNDHAAVLPDARTAGSSVRDSGRIWASKHSNTTSAQRVST
jgi:ribonucleotide monophosphatase NagD (HAD superfamily)